MSFAAGLSVSVPALSFGAAGLTLLAPNLCLCALSLGSVLFSWVVITILLCYLGFLAFFSGVYIFVFLDCFCVSDLGFSFVLEIYFSIIGIFMAYQYAVIRRFYFCKSPLRF